MSMRICFEQDYVLKTLDKSKKSDLAIIDPDGIDPKYIREAVAVCISLPELKESNKFLSCVISARIRNSICEKSH